MTYSDIDFYLKRYKEMFTVVRDNDRILILYETNILCEISEVEDFIFYIDWVIFNKLPISIRECIMVLTINYSSTPLKERHA